MKKFNFSGYFILMVFFLKVFRGGGGHSDFFLNTGRIQSTIFNQHTCLFVYRNKYLRWIVIAM